MTGPLQPRLGRRSANSDSSASPSAEHAMPKRWGPCACSDETDISIDSVICSELTAVATPRIQIGCDARANVSPQCLCGGCALGSVRRAGPGAVVWRHDRRQQSRSQLQRRHGTCRNEYTLVHIAGLVARASNSRVQPKKSSCFALVILSRVSELNLCDRRRVAMLPGRPELEGPIQHVCVHRPPLRKT